MNTIIYKIDTSKILIVRTLTALIILTLFTYFYFLNSAAFAAATQERLTSQISETQSTIGELELNFIEKTSAIDPEMANDYDLVSVNDGATAFAVRNNAEKLSFNE